MTCSISVFVLTYNEHLHIERCIRSLQAFSDDIHVVDSGSTDDTVALATRMGAHVVHHAWENNHARQTNWAIDNLPFRGDWVMRIDADEIVTAELADELKARVPALPAEITGLVLKRRQVFMGRVLRWGGNYPICLLRGFRKGLCRCEERWMDEHLVVTSGATLTLEHDLEDRNLNELRWWTTKEANYAVREAADTILARSQAPDDATTRDASNRRKRWLKTRVYGRLPLFVRPAAYFTYRYFLRLGFLDGRAGLIWHLLQGFWYRFLVDAVVFDIDRRALAEGRESVHVLEDSYGLRLRRGTD